MPEISPERRAELERLALAALSEDDWAKDRGPERATPAREGRTARVWYDDGDLCADVHDNIAVGLNGDTLAAFWAKATPLVWLALLRDLREVGDERDAAHAEGWQEAHDPRAECGHPRACWQDRNWPESERNYDPATKTGDPPMDYRCVVCDMRAERDAARAEAEQNRQIGLDIADCSREITAEHGRLAGLLRRSLAFRDDSDPAEYSAFLAEVVDALKEQP